MGYNSYLILGQTKDIEKLQEKVKSGYDNTLLDFYGKIEFKKDYLEPESGKLIFKEGQTAIYCGGERARGNLAFSILSATNVSKSPLFSRKFEVRDLAHFKGNEYMNEISNPVSNLLNYNQYGKDHVRIVGVKSNEERSQYKLELAMSSFENAQEYTQTSVVLTKDDFIKLKSIESDKDITNFLLSECDFGEMKSISENYFKNVSEVNIKNGVTLPGSKLEME
ncbi:hypothetical protein R2F61_07040 [Mollicutes bacterium LVI A0078]|nr:hypothetical protein RZE84_07045 [Mollicutes bacterium LVI A0075]WOO90479.1 hypothetical protein R2F61_07040 [Mollicutes bacterium LVI A0078]